EPNRHPGRMSEQPEDQRKSIDNSGCDQQTTCRPQNNADGADSLDESAEKQERSQKTGLGPVKQESQEMDDGRTHCKEDSPIKKSPPLDTIGEQSREPIRGSAIRDGKCFDTHCCSPFLSPCRKGNGHFLRNPFLICGTEYVCFQLEERIAQLAFPKRCF